MQYRCVGTSLPPKFMLIGMQQVVFVPDTLNYARYIASVQPGDPAVNCFIEAIPLLWMFRVRALKPIYAGSKVLIGTAIPKRYCVAKCGVLDCWISMKIVWLRIHDSQPEVYQSLLNVRGKEKVVTLKL
jgi:hypothetical protein